nr:MAG TPA: hypothetical protein [Caudoviricetes sp.]
MANEKPRDLSVVRYPYPMLSQGFCVQHRSLPSELLITHRSAAGSDSRPPVPILAFLSNVVPEALRVSQSGLTIARKPPPNR